MRTLTSAGLALAALLLLVGCSSTATTEASVAPGDVDAFETEVAAAYEEWSADQETVIPSEGPTPATDKKIYIVPCSMAAEGCARAANAQVEAAELLGWEATIIDPGGDAAKVSRAVTQATAEGADGIILIGNDAQAVLEPLRAAQEQGVKVISVIAGPNEAGQGVIDNQIPSNEDFVNDGYISGVAAYTLAEGSVHAIEMYDPEYGSVTLRREGFNRFMDECKAAGGDCEILGGQSYLLTELATAVPQKAVSLAQRFPSFNVFWDDYDASLTYQLQGLEQADLTRDDAFAISFDANAANLDAMRNGGFQKVDMGLPMVWVGYGTIDNLNRLFNGEEPVDQGIRSKVLTKDNLPETGSWDGDEDVRPLYAALWGK